MSTSTFDILSRPIFLVVKSFFLGRIFGQSAFSYSTFTLFVLRFLILFSPLENIPN